MKLIFLFGLLSVLLNSCIPDPLPVDNIAKPAEKIVVASQIVPGTGLVVFVTKSVGALEAGRNSDPEILLQQIAIADAQVTLHYLDKTDTLQNRGDGLYSLNKSDFVPGLSYALEVKTITLGTVTATTQVAERVAFTSVSTQLFKMGVDTVVQVDYSLNDPVGKNFYMISVQRFSRKQTVSNLLNPRIFTRLTDDAKFDGTRFEENFKTLFQRFSQGDSIAVVMASVNQDYYEFLKIRNDRFRFSDFSSEPFNYPSNVKGGYGFFNLHAQDARIFVLE